MADLKAQEGKFVANSRLKYWNWLQLGSSWQAGAWKKQWKYFWTWSVTYLHEAIACFCFFFFERIVIKFIQQQTVRPFSPLIISSYYFRPCVSYLKDQTQADSATIFTPDKPWQAAIGHYDTLCPVKTMLHTLLQMVLISLFFLLFSSFYRFLLYFIWLMWYWLFIFHHDTLRPVPKFFHTLCQIISTHWSLILLLLFQ